MSQAVDNHTTTAPAAPSRRNALRLSAAALVAGFTTPALAIAAAPDAELVTLCDQLVGIKTELRLLAEHDEHAPDFGPNHARYQQFADAQRRLTVLISECQSPTDAAGIAAIARAAMTWTERDQNGIAMCDDFGEEMMLKLAEGAAAGFVWPPRRGSCSTAHWGPPTSPQEIAEHRAAHRARDAQIDAEIQAKKLAEATERRRRDTPSLMLRGQLKYSLEFRARADVMATEASVELARRGLA
jgi:hypothetical protein